MSTLGEAVEFVTAHGRIRVSVVTDEERRELANIECWLASGTELSAVTVWWLLTLAQRLAGPALPSSAPSQTR